MTDIPCPAFERILNTLNTRSSQVESVSLIGGLKGSATHVDFIGLLCLPLDLGRIGSSSHLADRKKMRSDQ